MRRRKTPIADDERRIGDPERAWQRTMERALRLLAAKPRSVAELRERLLERSSTNAEIVDGVIGRLKEYRYLDDTQFAADLAVSKLRQRPQGRRRLEHVLGQKKLDRATIEAAAAKAFEALPEADLIDIAIDKRISLKGRPGTREDLQKFFAYLARQGFGFDLIREKMAALARNGLPEEN